MSRDGEKGPFCKAVTVSLQDGGEKQSSHRTGKKEERRETGKNRARSQSPGILRKKILEGCQTHRIKKKRGTGR